MGELLYFLLLLLLDISISGLFFQLEEIMEILLYSGDIAEGRPINEV